MSIANVQKIHGQLFGKAADLGPNESTRRKVYPKKPISTRQ